MPHLNCFLLGAGPRFSVYSPLRQLSWPSGGAGACTREVDAPGAPVFGMLHRSPARGGRTRWCCPLVQQRGSTQAVLQRRECAGRRAAARTFCLKARMRPELSTPMESASIFWYSSLEGDPGWLLPLLLPAFSLVRCRLAMSRSMAERVGMKRSIWGCGEGWVVGCVRGGRRRGISPDSADDPGTALT